METEQRQRAGFWVGTCAQLIDLALVAGAVILVAEAVAGLGLYIPIEITVVGVYLIYATVAVGWKGRTLGGAALGTRTTRRDGAGVGWVRALARVGTIVTRPKQLRARHRWAFAAVLGCVGLYVAFFAFDTLRLYRLHHAWVVGAEAAANRTQHAAKDVVDVASVETAQHGPMAAWLAEHGRDPVPTLIDLAGSHQVTIIGEIHGKKPYLELLNEIIPDLYHKAGVRTLAMECCHPDQNEDLNRLVQGKEFDRGLLLALARRASWRAWGYQGYWDALETVWRVNRSLAPGSEPLRVVGILPRFDGPSVFLMREGPWYEKLRIVRLGRTARLVAFHDACYARAVEQEAFDRGRRTVVWVGAAHTSLCPTVEMPGKDGTVRRRHRMGSMLFGRYGSTVAQAVLHYGTKEDRVAKLIEESARQCSKMRIAFATADSPFGLLRDGTDFNYRFRPARGLADYASYYIMLMPENEMRDCDWLEGFLTRRMLGENRSYYESLAGGAIHELNDGNRRIAQGMGRI